MNFSTLRKVMLKKEMKLYEGLLYSNMEFDEYSPQRRKVVLINILLIISGVILFTFTIYNYLISQNIKLFLIDFLSSLAVIAIFYDLRIFHNIQRSAFVTTLLVFSLMIAIVYFVEGKDFTLVWSVFFPIFAIFINGSEKGFLITTVFYAIVFYLTYQGIGVWQDGLWNAASYWRFVVASVGISIVVYFFEMSFDKAYEMLEHNRKKEQQYIETLEEYSITDPLTKLYNRRYLNMQFGKMFQKAKKHKSYFAFYIFDLDFFKQYNDTFGHIAGDTALKRIAWTLTHNVFKRDVDYIFRLGGEEFCGILIADELSNIQHALYNAKQAIEDLQLSHPHGAKDVLTASFGVAIIHSFEVEDFDKMYKIADRALYEAKARGRNCIVGESEVSTL